MNAHFTILDAPSILGLRPTGVETLPAALRTAGLQSKLGSTDAGVVVPPPYRAERDPQTHVLNGPGIQTYAWQLAEVIGPLVDDHQSRSYLAVIAAS